MKVLVANRGEIAIRILRTCREMGFPTVAVYSEADQGALHTRYADEALPIGPRAAAESYLNIAAILEAARRSGAEAIHPGYGFLSENADFARAVEEAGLVFIGPRPETLALTGDKLAARRIARETGLPVLPGPDLPVSDSFKVELASQIKFPVLIKAVAGVEERASVWRVHQQSSIRWWLRRAARRRPPSVMAPCTSNHWFSKPVTSRCRFWETDRGAT